ncbi:MAG TPA: L-histidine N(alpha)-methyltransferase, partial [Arenimonas sp.]|nr:L-histidine N(alpha)-methyltransferase [Arenimonas sp.]
MNATADAVELTDLHPSRDDLLGDVVAGLSGTPKRLPSKYFYDRRGSELFEEITRQPEYYLTRVELALLEAECADIASAVGPRVHVVEYGSGSGRKTRLLLDALEDPVAYTPVEISRSA